MNTNDVLKYMIEGIPWVDAENTFDNIRYRFQQNITYNAPFIGVTASDVQSMGGQ